MFYQRSKVYADPIETPTAITDGYDVTSSEYYPFENSAFGAAKLHSYAADLSKITDTLTATLSVSFDEGTTWEPAVSVSELANGAGAVSVFDSISYAPRVKLNFAESGSGAAAEGHGIGFNLQMDENFVMGGKFKLENTATTLYFTATNGPAYSDVLSVTHVPEKVGVIATADDLSEVTDGTGGLAYVLESSMDGTNYWTVTSAAKTDIANGSGTLYTEFTETSDLGLYFRVRLYDTNVADDAALTEAAGVKFYLVSMK
jgi:hypothetical protein